MRATVLIPLLIGALCAPTEAPAQDNGEADVVLVKMIEKSATKYVFSPSEITVRPGQTVRFVQEGLVPHNVEFKDVPSGAKLDGVRMGPFLMTKGETYEVRIDERFTEGSYDYVCTPHVMMGMKGRINVEERASTGEPPLPPQK